MNLKDRKWMEELLLSLPKRPRTLLEILLEKGEVSTYELGERGYDQPPRAAQDLKEAGVKLVTKNGKHPNTGARMAIYMLAPDQQSLIPSGGRIAFPKAFREELEKKYSNKCALCDSPYSSRFLQIDHKIPFIVGGEPEKFLIEEFQLLCASHQRMKSWECEGCPNREIKENKICGSCYWASPEDYTHVATKQHKLISLVLDSEEDIASFETAKGYAKMKGISVEDYIKALIQNSIEK